MIIKNEIISTRLIGGTLLAVATLLSILPRTFAASPPVDPAIHAAHLAAGAMPPDAPTTVDTTKGDPGLAQQIDELQVKMAQLEAALAKGAPLMAPDPAGAAMPGMAAASPPARPAMGMNMDKMKSRAMSAAATPAPAMAGRSPSDAPPLAPTKMMDMMDKMMGMMDKMMPMTGDQMPAATPPDAMSVVPMGKDKMTEGKKRMEAMMGRGSMGADTGAAMPQSALPGFPGASHLYHIGATDFFLDHSQHIALSTEQTAALNKAKEQALLAKSTTDRASEQAEQELWVLTASDQPDAAKIEIKIREIGKLTGDARLAFIRAIGEASKFLTVEQRKSLTGFAPPVSAGMAAPAAPMPTMKDM